MKKYMSAELEEILNDLSGIFDMVYYAYADDEETKNLINTTEDRLHKFLHEVGLIREDAWMKAAIYCEKTYGTYANFEEEYFICPECDEPIYKCDWENSELRTCPACEFDFYED